MAILYGLRRNPRAFGLFGYACVLMVLAPASAGAFTAVAYGPQLEDVAHWEPLSVTPLLQSPHRVGSLEGTGGGRYFYRCDATGLNVLLEAYANVDMERHEVFLWPSIAPSMTTKGMAIDDPPVRYNAVLDHPGPGLSLMGYEIETLYLRKPRLTLYVHEPALLERLDIPPNLDLVHPAERLDAIGEAIASDRDRFRAIRYLRDLGPDAMPFQSSLVEALHDDNPYIVESAKAALLNLVPNQQFRLVSDRIRSLIDERIASKETIVVELLSRAPHLVVLPFR